MSSVGCINGIGLGKDESPSFNLAPIDTKVSLEVRKIFEPIPVLSSESGFSPLQQSLSKKETQTEISAEFLRYLISDYKQNDLDQILKLMDDPKLIKKLDARELAKIGHILLVKATDEDIDRSTSILEEAASRLEGTQNEPILLAEILTDLGNAYIANTRNSEAIHVLSRALGNCLMVNVDSPVRPNNAMVKALFSLGVAFGYRDEEGDLDQAIAMLSKASNTPCPNQTISSLVFRNLWLYLSKRNGPGDLDSRILAMQKSTQLVTNPLVKLKDLGRFMSDLLRRGKEGDRELLIYALRDASRLPINEREKLKVWRELLETELFPEGADKRIKLLLEPGEIRLNGDSQMALKLFGIIQEMVQKPQLRLPPR